jgi:hypothetical protein
MDPLLKNKIVVGQKSPGVKDVGAGKISSKKKVLKNAITMT